MKAKQISLSQVITDCKEFLHLKSLNRHTDSEYVVTRSDIGVPGLILAGLGSAPHRGQIQVLGENEISYLKKLETEQRSQAIARLGELDVPCIVLAGSDADLDTLAEDFAKCEIPVLSSDLSMTQVLQYLSSYLEVELAPEITLNGTLVDVYGVGILLRGPSGIGKSECALDLVERGHRLVADDLIKAIAKPPGVLIGRSVAPLQNYVEVRGIGLIDIGSIYGIRSLRRQKRIEVEVNLTHWEKGVSFDRSGVETSSTEILGIRIPSVIVPLVPGKSISVIVEVIALSHTLKTYGYDPTTELDRRWLERLKARARKGFEPRDTE